MNVFVTKANNNAIVDETLKAWTMHFKGNGEHLVTVTWVPYCPRKRYDCIGALQLGLPAHVHPVNILL